MLRGSVHCHIMEEQKDNKPGNSFRIVWGAFMTLAYIGIAYLVLFTPILIRYNATNDPQYDNNKIVRIIFGVVLLLYGIVRGYRTWKTGR